MGSIFKPYQFGTSQERIIKPELNTNKLELYYEILDEFGKSKYQNDIYLGPRGGVYYYSSYGLKKYV